MKQFSGPIPGQSLTLEPKAYPWERPPEITDPEEAIQMHLSRLSDPEMLSGILDMIELDELDVKTITTGIMRGAVASGIHSIDVALIVAPVVHEFIKQAAIAFGLHPDDGFKNKKEKADYEKAKNAQIIKKAYKNLGTTPKEVAKEVKVVETEQDTAAPMAAPKGLMARGEM